LRQAGLSKVMTCPADPDQGEVLAILQGVHRFEERSGVGVPMTADKQSERRAFDERLKAIPPIKVDPSRWPKQVRPIVLEETEGLGIDADGRLYWNGRSVEIITQRLVLTRAQTI
jgi:hypothetical protein